MIENYINQSLNRRINYNSFESFKRSNQRKLILLRISYFLVMSIGLRNLISSAPTNGFIVLYRMAAVILGICFQKILGKKL